MVFEHIPHLFLYVYQKKMNTQLFVLKSKKSYIFFHLTTCPPAFDEVVRHALGSDHLTPVVGTRNFLLRIQHLVLCHCNLDLIKKIFQKTSETNGLHLWLSVTVKYTNYKEVLREGYCMMPLNQQIELGLYFSIMLTILLGFALGRLYTIGFVSTMEIRLRKIKAQFLLTVYAMQTLFIQCVNTIQLTVPCFFSLTDQSNFSRNFCFTRQLVRVIWWFIFFFNLH